jgi:hypothetical protein
VGKIATLKFGAIDKLAGEFAMTASEKAALDAGAVGHEARLIGSGPWLFSLPTMHGELSALYAESATYLGLNNTDRAFRLWDEGWLAVDRATLES